MVENKNKQENLIAKKKIFSNYNNICNSSGLANSTQKAFGSKTNSFVEKAMETMSLSNVAQNVINSMKINFNTQKTIELMTKNFVLEAERKAVETMSLSSVAQNVIDSMKMNYNTQKTIELMTNNFAQKTMESISLSSVAQSVLESMKKDYDIQKAIGSMHQSVADKAMASISLSSAAQTVMDSLKNNEAFYQSILSLAQPAYRDSAFDIINKSVLNNPSNLSYQNIHFDSDALEDNIQKLSDAQNHKIFSNIFAKIPLPVQIIIIFIFLHIIMPQINSILITPCMNKYLSRSKATDKEKIKEISKIKLDNPVLEVDKLRFITRSNVILRSGPSTKTEMLDELYLGQVVTVLSKKRNWIEIHYLYQDNEILHGWVFTRYTARFKK